MDILSKQYQLVQGARAVLLDYCEGLSPKDFVRELEQFGRGSIRNLLVHITTTYQFWLASFAMKQNVVYPKYDAIQTLSEVRPLFENVDAIVNDFLQQFQNQLDTPIIGKTFSGDRALEIAPFVLLTHVITHEFHHKGQILSMSRHLGYIPLDTDVLR